METPQQSSAARLAAILALAVAFAVIAVVGVSSLGAGDSGRNPSSTVGGKAGAQSNRKTYVVKPGDTLSRIAAKVGVSVEALQRLNPKLDQFSLQSGDRVKLR